MDEVDVRATVRVSCPGVEIEGTVGNNEHHTIKLLRNGKLVLCDHKDDLKDHLGMYEFDPGYRCRCLEVLTWWRIYAAGPVYLCEETENKGEYANVCKREGHYPKDGWGRTLQWIRDAMEGKQETHKYAFYQIPKGLQAAAKEGFLFHDMRRRVRWEAPQTGWLAQKEEVLKNGTYTKGGKSLEHLYNHTCLQDKWSELRRGDYTRGEALHWLLSRYLRRRGMDVSLKATGYYETRGYFEHGRRVPFKLDALKAGWLVVDAPDSQLFDDFTAQGWSFYVKAKRLERLESDKYVQEPALLPDHFPRYKLSARERWVRVSYDVHSGEWTFTTSNNQGE